MPTWEFTVQRIVADPEDDTLSVEAPEGYEPLSVRRIETVASGLDSGIAYEVVFVRLD